MKFQTIISASILVNYLESPEIIILDCRGGAKNNSLSYAKYLKSHIPNAYYCCFSSEKESNLDNNTHSNSASRSLDETNKVLNNLAIAGFDSKSQVIIYGEDTDPLIDTIWLKFRSLGCQNVAVLQGGFSSWVAQNMPLANSSKNVVMHDTADAIH